MTYEIFTSAPPRTRSETSQGSRSVDVCLDANLASGFRSDRREESLRAGSADQLSRVGQRRVNLAGWR